MKQPGFLFLLSFIAASSTFAQSSPKEISNQMENVFFGIASSDTPGFAVLIKKDGKILFEQGYGVRDLRTKTKIDEQTNFRLASFTKQFTAMAAMLLVHDGKLRYDESLTELFPEFPAYGKTITVRNLLNHTSGLPDYEDLMDQVEKTKGPIWSPENQIHDAEVLQLLERESQGKFAMGVQQFRLCGSRIDRCEGFWKSFRRISARSNFCATENESHACF